jgi:hypothetical protein
MSKNGFNVAIQLGRGCSRFRSVVRLAVAARVSEVQIPQTGQALFLAFHWAGEVDGKWTVTDVWASREAYERFRAERLFPAIKKVSRMDPQSGPQPTVNEHPVHNYIKP